MHASRICGDRVVVLSLRAAAAVSPWASCVGFDDAAQGACVHGHVVSRRMLTSMFCRDTGK